MVVNPSLKVPNKNVNRGVLKPVPKPRTIPGGPNRFINIAKETIQKQRSKVNKDNVIYYFSGFTILVIFIVYAVPIIYFNLTKKSETTTKIGYTQVNVTNLPNPEKPKIDNTEIVIKSVKPKVSKAYSVPNPESMKKIFEQGVSDSKADILFDYIEPDAKLFLWKPSEAGNGCCEVEKATPEYILNFLTILNLEKPTWNFDQNQSDIKGVQDIEGRFRDSYIGISNKDSLVGIKLSAKNRIIEVVATASIKEMYKSVGNYGENNKAGFQKITLTEEEIRQLNQK